MALILKETCCRCETITRDAKTFVTQDKDYKTICKDCISDLGLEGFIKYRKSFVDPVKYEDLLRYEQKLHEIVTTASNYPTFYFDDDFDKDYTQGMGATRKTIIRQMPFNFYCCGFATYVFVSSQTHLQQSVVLYYMAL